jgi:hypothetical protein
MISQDLQGLLTRIRDHHHALSQALSTAVTEMYGIKDRIAAKKSELARSGTHTAQGQVQELTKVLPGTLIDLLRARAPIEKAYSDNRARRAAIQIKSPDPNNFAAAIERWALQDYLSSLDPGQREALALTTTDRRILEAIVFAPPELSGFVGNLAPAFKKVEARYLEVTHSAELKSIAAAEAVMAEASAAAQIVRDQIQQTVGMNDREFAAVMEPIERKVGAPWLVKIKGGSGEILRVRPEKCGTAEFQTPATPEEIRDGVFYESDAAYQAARAPGEHGGPSNGAAH